MRLYTSELVKKYKARTVVNHVSIDVNQGEIVGLLGPNGAGKTTTFYMIVGLIKPNEGQIFLEDDNGQVAELTKEPVYRRAQMVWVSGAGGLGFPPFERRGQHQGRSGDDRSEKRTNRPHAAKR